MNREVVEIGLGQARLIGKKSINKLDKARLFFAKLLRRYENFVGREKCGAGLGFRQSDQPDLQIFFSWILPMQIGASAARPAEDTCEKQRSRRDNPANAKLHCTVAVNGSFVPVHAAMEVAGSSAKDEVENTPGRTKLVGTGRFELPTPRTPSECSTRLSHVPTGNHGP